MKSCASSISLFSLQKEDPIQGNGDREIDSIDVFSLYLPAPVVQ